MKQCTIFGFTNYRYFVNNPHGKTHWFSTRLKRDSARATMIYDAAAAGLDDAHSAFTPVRKICRTRLTHRWLEHLITYGKIQEIDEMLHIWVK